MLYPARMTRVYYNSLEKLATKVSCFSVLMNGMTSYEEHKKKLALEYYAHNLSKMYSVFALIVSVCYLRYGYNTDFWPFSIYNVYEPLFVSYVALYSLQVVLVLY